MTPGPKLFRLLLALAFHTPPSLVDRLFSAKDKADLRRLYAYCPFGPLRGDLQAWLGGMSAACGGKLSMERASRLLWFKKPKRKRERREKPRGVTGAQMKDWVLSMGGVVIEKEPGK